MYVSMNSVLDSVCFAVSFLSFVFFFKLQIDFYAEEWFKVTILYNAVQRGQGAGKDGIES